MCPCSPIMIFPVSVVDCEGCRFSLFRDKSLFLWRVQSYWQAEAFFLLSFLSWAIPGIVRANVNNELSCHAS